MFCVFLYTNVHVLCLCDYTAFLVHSGYMYVKIELAKKKKTWRLISSCLYVNLVTCLCILSARDQSSVSHLEYMYMYLHYI